MRSTKHFRNLHISFLLLFVSFLLCFFLSVLIKSHSQASSESIPPVTIYDGWQYRLGDSPKDEKNIPSWIFDTSNSTEWNSIAQPSRLFYLNKDGKKDVWLRFAIPNNSWKEPCLFFRSLEQTMELYVDGNLIYKYGDISATDRKITLGSAFHLVPLPQNSQGKFLYMRMHSSSVIYTGNIIAVELGDKEDLSEARSKYDVKLIRQEIDYVILGPLFIFLGLGMIFMSLLKERDEKSYLFLGFSSVFSGLWLISVSKLIFYIIDAPIVWMYLSYIALQLVPVGFCFFIGHIFGKSRRTKSFVENMGMFFIFYSIVSVVLDITNLASLSVTIRLFHILVFVTGLLGIMTFLRAAMKDDFEAKIFSFSFLLLAICTMFDVIDKFYMPRSILDDHYIFPWSMLVFILSLAYISAHRLIAIFNRLKSYSKEIELKNETLNQMWQEVTESRDKIAQWNKDLERIVEQRTSDVKNLLNNAGQGFLTFGEDLLVDEEYSLECINIFQKRIEGKTFSELVFTDEDQKKYLDVMLLKILNEKSEGMRQLYIPLLPDEILIKNKYINVKYKLIDVEHKTFMAILTDITDKRFLETQMKRERSILKMVVKAITNYDEFSKCIKDYQSFCDVGVQQILGKNSPLENIVFEIFRSVHTFKGTFSQIDMVNIVDRLHSFETQLSDMRKNLSDITLEDFKSFILKSDLCEWLNDDTGIIEDVLGEHFLNREKAVYVDEERLKSIEKKVVSVLSPSQYNLLLPDIKKLRYKPFRSLLETYPDYIMKLADTLEKPLNIFEIEGGEVLVDPERYYPFTRSLVNVFKNMVDHGLDTLDERIQSGKEEYGSITCNITLINNKISIMIADNGRGIDLNSLREIAINTGIYDRETAYAKPDKEILNLIFKDGFTTRETASELSGRGVGLSAVKEQLDKLGGFVNISTEPGLGTEFHFLIPYDEMTEMTHISVNDIMNPLIETTKAFVKENADTVLISQNNFKIEKHEKLSLKEVSAFLNVSGLLEGTFVISMDVKLIRHVVSKLISDNLSPDEVYNYSEAVAAECANIILGNSLKTFPDLEDYLTIESPFTICSSDTSLNYLESEVWTCRLESRQGGMDISFVALKDTNLL